MKCQVGSCKEERIAPLNNASRRRIATFLLIFASWVGLLTVLDPTNGGFGGVQIPVLKYMPFWLSAIASLLYFFSSKGYFSKLEFSLVSFVSIMILGSLWNLMFQGASLQESYLGRAIGGFVLIAFLLISRFEGEVLLFFRFFVPALFISVAIMFFVLILFRVGIVYQELPQMYQVKAILFASAGILALLWLKNKKIKLLMFLMAALGLLLIQKTTALLLMVLLCCYGFYIYLTEGKKKLLVSFNKVGIWGLLIVGVLVSIFTMLIAIYGLVEHRVNEGARENEVRAITLQMRWDEFVESPVYGNFFTGSPLVDVSTLHIPAHSDVLDFLAMGGVISILLFFSPVLIQMLRNIRLKQSLSRRNWLSFTILVSMLVMVMNPILSMPGLSFVFWMSIGLLLAFCPVKQLPYGRNNER